MRTAGGTGHRALAAVLVLLLVSALGVGVARASRADNLPSGDCSGRHWVSAWMTAPQDSAGAFRDQTIRSIVTVTASGTAVRITLSNRFGDAPVVFDDVHVAERLVGASVDPRTVRAVTFDGADAVRVAPGEQVVSDAVELAVAAGDELAVSYHVDGPAALDRHLQAVQTSYLTHSGAGRHGADVVGSAFTQESTSWFGLAAVDVEAPRAVGAVAVLGDSLTEGLGSTVDAGRRWTDVLARRLDGRMAVLNAGIGGNHVTRAFALSGEAGRIDFGPGGASRLDADVLRRSGVTDLVVYEGVNDVFTQLRDDVPRAVERAYERIIAEAHAAGLQVIGVTLTPMSQTGVKEADRQAINAWIRTSGAFDAVVDFDRVVADRHDGSRLQPAFDTDRVHLTDAGYRAVGEAFDVSVLRGTRCAA